MSKFSKSFCICLFEISWFLLYQECWLWSCSNSSWPLRQCSVLSCWFCFTTCLGYWSLVSLLKYTSNFVLNSLTSFLFCLSFSYCFFAVTRRRTDCSKQFTDTTMASLQEEASQVRVLGPLVGFSIRYLRKPVSINLCFIQLRFQVGLH